MKQYYTKAERYELLELVNETKDFKLQGINLDFPVIHRRDRRSDTGWTLIGEYAWPTVEHIMTTTKKFER